MSAWWSWLLTAVGVFGIYLTTRKLWAGYVVGLSAQALWVTYAIATRQWGFIASAAAYGWVYALGWYRWTRPATPASDPRISEDDDGTLDDFLAENVKLVHFEATDNAAWYATITLADGRSWQLHFGAEDPELAGHARADQIS